jgi:hypothetical protein
VILDRIGQPLFWFTLWGWQREITEFDLYGVLVSLSQMVVASASDQVRLEGEKHLVLRLIALVALLSLVSFEVGASFYRGLMLAGPWNASLSAALALGVATMECIVGVFLLDRFLIPLLLAMLWTITAPFHGLARWCGRRRPQPSRPIPLMLVPTYPLAAVDRALMSPLRQVDNFVKRILIGTISKS